MGEYKIGDTVPGFPERPTGYSGGAQPQRYFMTEQYGKRKPVKMTWDLADAIGQSQYSPSFLPESQMRLPGYTPEQALRGDQFDSQGYERDNFWDGGTMYGNKYGFSNPQMYGSGTFQPGMGAGMMSGNVRNWDGSMGSGSFGGGGGESAGLGGLEKAALVAQILGEGMGMWGDHQEGKERDRQREYDEEQRRARAKALAPHLRELMAGGGV